MSQNRPVSSTRGGVALDKEKPVRIRRFPRSCIPGRMSRAPKGRHCASGKTSGLSVGESLRSGKPEELVLCEAPVEAQRDVKKGGCVQWLHVAFLCKKNSTARCLHREKIFQTMEGYT